MRRKKNKLMSYRSGDSRGLGALGTLLPAPGAPEPMGIDVDGYIKVGSCNCNKPALGDVAGLPSMVVRVGSGAAAYLAYKQAKKARGSSKYLLYAIAGAAAYESVFGG